MKSLNSLKSRKSDSEYISGPKNCNGKHLCYAFSSTYAYYSTWLERIKGVESTDECNNICNEDPKCQAFTFYHYYEGQSEGSCSTFALPLWLNPSYGYRSGLKFCNENFHMSEFNITCRDYFAKFIDSNGDRKRLMLSHSYNLLTRDCEQHCRDWNIFNASQGLCTFYEHDFMLMDCWLFQSGVELTAFFSPTSVIGRVSGICNRKTSTLTPTSLKWSVGPSSTSAGTKIYLRSIVYIACVNKLFFAS